MGRRARRRGDGAAALEKCSQEEFDLIVMDFQMPVMDGFQALEGLRGRGVEVPVIALTAHAMKGDRERCLGAGFSAYLAKPAEGRELVGTVATLLGEASGEKRRHYSRHAARA